MACALTFSLSDSTSGLLPIGAIKSNSYWLSRRRSISAKYGAKLPGAAGVPNDAIKKAISLGVAKINIDTDIRLAMTAALRQVLVEHPEEFDPRKIMGPAEDAMKAVARSKMQLFGSSGKA